MDFINFYHITTGPIALTTSFSNSTCAINGGVSIAFSADNVSLFVTGEVSQFIVPLHTEGGTV